MSNTEIFIVATGSLATRVVELVDDVEPELVSLVRSLALWLDPGFPQAGHRAPAVRGGWVDDQQIETEFTQAEEFTPDGRGIRILRICKMTPGGFFEGALRVIAVGLVNGSRLELRWNMLASASEVRGTSAELTVEGAGADACAAEFRSKFDPV